MKKETFFGEADYRYNLAFFRISTALLTIVYTLVIYKDAPYIYGKNGLVFAEVNDAIIDRVNIRFFYDAFDFITHNEVYKINIFLNLYILVLILLALGFYSRITAIFAWFMNWILLNSSFSLMYGYDIFTNNCLMYCILMPVGYNVSIDNYFRQKSKSTLYETLSIIVLRFHLCIIYFFSGLNKAVAPQWWNGEAIWRSTMQPPMQIYNLELLANIPLVAKGLGIGVVIAEISFFLLAWNRITRKIILAILILMHLSIGLFMGLWFFAFIMIIMDVTALSNWKFHNAGSSQKCPKEIFPTPQVQRSRH